MKNIIKSSILAVLFAGVLYGCKKVEVQTVLQDGVPSALTASQATGVGINQCSGYCGSIYMDTCAIRI
jgi:hypothetical protein